jgi:hypothetical protein
VSAGSSPHTTAVYGPWRAALRKLGLPLAALLLGTSVRAEQIVTVTAPRDATFAWDESRAGLFASFTFHDAVDLETQSKLTRGLPTEILLTGLLFATDSDTPVSATFQSCRITWHVWEEMYRIEITRANHPAMQRQWSPSLGGVLRRCAEVNSLLVADSNQINTGRSVYLKATVRINPLSAELQSKLKRWVNRPSPTTTASPGSALFSTFTGLFMQRIGDAERTLTFSTTRGIPVWPFR